MISHFEELSLHLDVLIKNKNNVLSFFNQILDLTEFNLSIVFCSHFLCVVVNVLMNGSLS